MIPKRSKNGSNNSNRMKLNRLLLTCFLLIVLAPGSMAQTLESLRKEIEQAEKEISITNNLLSKTRQDQKTTEKQLNLIRTKIRNRRNIISNLEQQTRLIGNDIAQKDRTIASLEQELSDLRKEYGAMVYNAYKNYKLNNFMVFLFASKDFDDATRRIAYMKRYNRMRERKAVEIDSVAASLNRELSALQDKKNELDDVHRSRNAELASLSKDETQYKSSSDKLRSEAGRLASDIKTKKSKIDRLQQQIQRIIAEASRKENALSKTRTSEQKEYIAKLSGQFGQNKGKLPYPVRGVIVDTYGVHAHATIKGLSTRNNGVNIAADPGVEVRAVFEGEAQVFLIPGMGSGIIIRHGSYMTVYGNLASVNVKTGDRVALGQTIGRIPSGSDDDSYLHFEIWKETPNQAPSSLDPAQWIRR